MTPKFKVGDHVQTLQKRGTHIILEVNTSGDGEPVYWTDKSQWVFEKDVVDSFIIPAFIEEPLMDHKSDLHDRMDYAEKKIKMLLKQVDNAYARIKILEEK